MQDAAVGEAGNASRKAGLNIQKRRVLLSAAASAVACLCVLHVGQVARTEIFQTQLKKRRSNGQGSVVSKIGSSSQ